MKKRATEDDVWQFLFESLNISDGVILPITDKKTVVDALRAKEMVVPNNIRKELWKMIDTYKSTREYKQKWLDIMYDTAKIPKSKRRPIISWKEELRLYVIKHHSGKQSTDNSTIAIDRSQKKE